MLGAQTRLLALAGIIAPVLFTALVVLQGWLIPAYSHVRLPISALAAWPTGWIQDVNFLAVGGLAIAFAYALHRTIQPTRRGAWAFPLLVAGGLGIAVASLFPWVMIDGVPTETPGHVAAAVTAFAASGLGWLALSRRMSGDDRWRDLSTYTMVTGIAMLLLFVALGFFAIEDGAPLHPWAGLLQRVLCAVWFTCLIVLAVRARRIAS